ncbi:MAG: hypothetical protein Alis3KO_31990 [Aliiglaciecola sp.]
MTTKLRCKVSIELFWGLALWIFALIMFVCWAIPQHSLAESKPITLTLAINAPGSAPYLYLDETSQTYQGAVMDFFKSLSYESNIQIELLETSRSRIERFTRTGVNDVFLSSQAWLSSPEGFVFSEPFIEHKSYLYSSQPFKSDFALASLKNALVCTRYGYTYPVLQEYFEKGTMIRVNSSSQATMTSMLVKNRCDFAIMNEYNARSAFLSTLDCNHTFYQSPTIVSKVDLVFVVNATKQRYVKDINQHLMNFIQSGQRDKAMLEHTGGFSFPFRAACSVNE